MSSADSKAQLAEARAHFRAGIEQAGAARIWQNFPGRIAAVLPGGGARGAYEAGVLLAFQDARLPTHILSASSIGSINAASYAAHSHTLVGNAESLVESWFDLTPTVVGVEWTKYVWVLTGLIAASAGFGNLTRQLLSLHGFLFSLHDPKLTWFSLGLAGVAVLWLHDKLPYLVYIIRNYFRGTSWKPDRRKALQSVLANLVVWSFIGLVLHSLHLPAQFMEFVSAHPRSLALGGALLALFLLAFRRPWRAPLSAQLYKLLRLPLRAGLFANFERGRFLRQRISTERLHASPMRLVFTATDLEAGSARYFSNAEPEQLARDAGAEARFVAQEVSTASDLMRAVIASSALPIAFEPIILDERLYTDGAVVANQPIRPAIRLGADVLFLVLMDPPGSRLREVKTFVDVGLRALDILMSQNLLTDLKVLSNINAVCEQAATNLDLRPEEVEIELGRGRYRYIKAFTIRPAAPLGGTMFDFGGKTTGPAILQGYRDACAQIENFLAYAPQAKFGQPRRLLRFSTSKE